MSIKSRTAPYELSGVMLSDISHTTKERQDHVSVEADHEYEILDKYSQAYEEIQAPQAPPPKQEQQQLSSVGNYELTQCPAYIPVTYGNKQTGVSLMQPTTTGSTDEAAAAEDKGQGMSKADDDQKKDNGTMPCEVTSKLSE